MDLQDLLAMSRNQLLEMIPEIAVWDSMNFRTIRLLAKKAGVQSPTSKSKEQNIKEMQEIAQGIRLPKKERNTRKTKAKEVEDFLKKMEPVDNLLRQPAPELIADEPLKVSPAHAEEERHSSSERPLPEKISAHGILEIIRTADKTYGFLRQSNLEYSKDVYVPAKFLDQFALRKGDEIDGTAYVQQTGNPSLCFIRSVNGNPMEGIRKRVLFENLTAVYPKEQLKLETPNSLEFSLRALDLLAPIGKGQRGLIVAPPKAGKTTLLKKIAQAISKNNPEVYVMVLLIDERPEEVTDMSEAVDAEVIYSTNDQPDANHIRVAELAVNRAMRLVENKKDVVILMDSLTKLARAYNKVIDGSGRTLSGGLDISALSAPKSLFCKARNVKEGGSLTMVATVLVETNSRMDEVIFEELKGTGNMEVVLSRKLSEKRIFPAIDIAKSGTRNDQLLLSREAFACATDIRRTLSGNLEEGTETFLDLLTCTSSNEELIYVWNKKYHPNKSF